MDWIIAQEWSNLLFLHYQVPKELIRKSLPSSLEIDTYLGDAYISIVPFFMSNIRFPYLPSWDIFKLWELNLRTYVLYKGKPGVYFYTLDTDSLIGKFIAREFFKLPYRYKPMRGIKSGKDYSFVSEGQFSVRAQIKDEFIASPLSHWLTERYSLYTISKKNNLYQGNVIHKKWQLRDATLIGLENNFSKQFAFNLSSPTLVNFASIMNVKFKPLIKLL